MNDIKKLAKLLKDADENAQAKGITDYNDAILDNAEYLIKHGVVVEVVMCKDCKHCETPTCPITGIEVYFCRYGIKPMEVKDNFYCGHGERKDGNGK